MASYTGQRRQRTSLLRSDTWPIFLGLNFSISLCWWRQFGNLGEAGRKSSEVKCLGKLWASQLSHTDLSQLIKFSKNGKFLKIHEWIIFHYYVLSINLNKKWTLGTWSDNIKSIPTRTFPYSYLEVLKSSLKKCKLDFLPGRPYELNLEITEGIKLQHKRVQKTIDTLLWMTLITT